MSLVVTLTTTSARLNTAKYTLLSLLDQSVRADQIVICLSKEPYLIDEGVKELPSWLQDMSNQNSVTIKWVENTGPYRKLIPVYKESTDDDWLVTCDDDVIYGPNWLKSLVETAQNNPEAIVCGRARKPAFNLWGRQQSYVNWSHVPSGASGPDLLPIGVAGVLYRKPLIDNSIMLSEEFLRLAPKQDDLWFDLARKQMKTHVIVAGEANKNVYEIDVPGALSDTNASTSSSDWDNFFKAGFERVSAKVRGYMGFHVCGNDAVIAALDNFSKKLDQFNS